MANKGYHAVVLQYPLKGIREPEPKWEYFIEMHETVRAESLDSRNGIVNCYELQRKIVLVNKMVYIGIPRFGKGQMEYSPKFVRMLFWNKANWGNLEILKRRGRKGARSTPLATSSAKFEVITSGFREAVV